MKHLLTIAAFLAATSAFALNDDPTPEPEPPEPEAPADPTPSPSPEADGGGNCDHGLITHGCGGVWRNPESITDQTYTGGGVK